ncbi:MAG: hypothetical protein MZV63_01125 [Marinilabiliales bacterium]|nr:hypothetical protein [Marinilabiliales bacterium]
MPAALLRINIREAGLAGTVEIAERDFFNSPPPAEEGVLDHQPARTATVSVASDMGEFYGAIGSVLKHHYTGYTAWILSGDQASLKAVALKTIPQI